MPCAFIHPARSKTRNAPGVRLPPLQVEARNWLCVLPEPQTVGGFLAIASALRKHPVKDRVNMLGVVSQIELFFQIGE